jgi:hypothetical protein
MRKLTKLTKLLTLAASAAVLSAAFAKEEAARAAQPPVDQAAAAVMAKWAQTEATRKIGMEYAREFWLPETTMKQRMDPLSEDYVEHAAANVRWDELNHTRGKEGFRTWLIALSRIRGGGPPVGAPTLPNAQGQRLGNTLYQVVAEGDLVQVTYQMFLPDPQHQGKVYEHFGFDTFEVHNGKITAHWDNTDIPADGSPFLRIPTAQMKLPKVRAPIYGVDADSANWCSRNKPVCYP